MKKTEIKELVESLNKSQLKTLIELANKQLNKGNIEIGDEITLIIKYMIGDANGKTTEECDLAINSQDDLDALNIILHILDKHTSPNEGYWGFSLDERSFSHKSKEIYNLLYDQEKAPKTFNNIKITENILETISEIVDECFRGETEYSFLTYQGYEISQ